METKKIEEQIKSAVYVTVGAATLMLDKAKELVTQFEEVGKKSCEAHRINNEELKRNIQEALKKGINITIEQEGDTDSFVNKMDTLSAEELAKIKAKLSELEEQIASSNEAEKTPSENTEE